MHLSVSELKQLELLEKKSPQELKKDRRLLNLLSSSFLSLFCYSCTWSGYSLCYRR